MNAFESNCLFEEAYWLQAAAPDQWAVAEVWNENSLIGRLPYVVKRRLNHTLLIKPHYTVWLGPWVRATSAKYVNEVGHQHQVLAELIKKLPAASLSQIACSPESKNVLPFHWAGFKISAVFTHRLDTSDLSAIWDGMRQSTRYEIRKAEKQVEISEDCSILDLIGAVEKTFKRQSLDVSVTFPVLERIEAEMASRAQRKIYAAKDSRGRIHAAVYIVYDCRHTFYLAGGGDPELRQSGGHSLALWHAIKQSHSNSSIFDFSGSMVPSIENFVRGFGARQESRYVAEKALGLGRLYRSYQAFRGR